MPTMFDSHDEFNEWFSKDIENHAERQSGIDAGNNKNICDPLSQRGVKSLSDASLQAMNEMRDTLYVLPALDSPTSTDQNFLIF